MDEFWSSLCKSASNSTHSEPADPLQLVTIDEQLVNDVANSVSIESSNHDSSDDLLDLFDREKLKKLSAPQNGADEFLSKFKDVSTGQSNGLPPESSVESLLNKFKSSDNDYLTASSHKSNTPTYGTRRSLGVNKLVDTTNIRKSTDTSKPTSKRLIHNKIDQTVVDPNEDDDELLKLFNRDLIRNHERYSPINLQEYTIHDEDLDNLINVDEIDEAKELAERREFGQLDDVLEPAKSEFEDLEPAKSEDQDATKIECEDLEPAKSNDQEAVKIQCNDLELMEIAHDVLESKKSEFGEESEKLDHDVRSCSSEEIDVVGTDQLPDLPADEDSVSLPEIEQANLEQLRADLNMSGDLEDSNSRESFQMLTVDSTSLHDIYKPEKLLQKRIRKNGRSEYLVKYENLDDDQTHWESEKTLDPKMVEEFNRKYGDRLLLKDLDKKTYSKYFDRRIDETVPTVKDAAQNAKASVDLKQLIEKSIGHPLCNFYSNVRPERIVGVYPHEGRFYFLVKWEKHFKGDLMECSKFQERWPDVTAEYYESKIIFNDLEERRDSAEISAKRKLDLLKQPE